MLVVSGKEVTTVTDKEIIETFRLCASAKCKECDRDIHDCQKIYKEAYDLLTRLTATGDGYKIKCSRQDDCGNFPARCHECHAMADIIHHKPYYRHKDNVQGLREARALFLPAVLCGASITYIHQPRPGIFLRGGC